MKAWPSNRQYCTVCQIVRDDVRRAGKPLKARKCVGLFGDGDRLDGTPCDTFYPVRSSYLKCYCCTDFKGGERDTHPPCNKCGKRYRTAFGLVETCMQCVQSTEQMRDAYLGKLRAIYKERLTDPKRQEEAVALNAEYAQFVAQRKAKKVAA
tara:strand:+ start:671 stop:1126 length:456 start_codon:yes stop_codon:yes gene_type:complete